MTYDPKETVLALQAAGMDFEKGTIVRAQPRPVGCVAFRDASVLTQKTKVWLLLLLQKKRIFFF